MTSKLIPFWPKGTVAGSNSGGAVTAYTQSFPTREFTEVVAQLNFDAMILNPGGSSSMTVTPQISADGQQWEDQSPFTAVTPGSSYPTKEAIKIEEISEFMRFKIVLADGGGGGYSGGTFALYGVGKVRDEGDEE